MRTPIQLSGRALALALFVLALPSVARSQPAPPAAPDAATPRRDPLEDTLAELQAARAADPKNGAVLYVLAMYLDRAERPDEAIARLQELAALDWDYALDDADFVHSRTRPAYRAVAETLARRAPRVTHTRPWRRLAVTDLRPEGIAYDRRRKWLFLSSGTGRKVLRVDARGATSDFVPEAQDGLLATLGLHVDPERRHLWVVSAAAPFMHGHRPEDEGRSAVHVFDIDSGETVARFTLGAPAQPSLLNDLVLLGEDTALVSDTVRGAIYEARLGAPELSPFVPPQALDSPNGLTLSPDRRQLYVATFRGLYRVPLDTRVPAPLAQRDPRWNFAGIDGLVLYRDSLVGIQNLVGRARIWRLHLDGAGALVERAVILESGSPEIDNPTTGVVVGRDLVLVANPRQGGGAEPLRVVRIGLGR